MKRLYYTGIIHAGRSKQHYKYTGEKDKKERRQEQVEKVKKLVEEQDYKYVTQRALPMSEW